MAVSVGNQESQERQEQGLEQQEQAAERAREETYLEKIIELAQGQLARARKAVDERQAEMDEVKKEVRENTEHRIMDLSDTADFEALVELNQSAAPMAEMAADCEELTRKIRRLENLVRSPYFARIDFCFEGEDVPEKVYIGRTSLMEKGAADIYVYDWRSPIASVFYRFMTGEAYYDAPNGRITGNVERKRQYEIRDSRLLYFFDTNVSIQDEILKQLLSKNTSPQMKTIVETIQREQDIVIRNMENDLLMIQGVAGSGKTSIALHRAAYLMYQGVQSGLAANNILIISPNTAFERYISNVLPELGEENVVSMVFEDILQAVLPERAMQPQSAFLEQAMAHNSCSGLVKASMAFKTSGGFMELLDRFVEEIPLREIQYQDIFFQEELAAAKEEMREWILRRPQVPLGERLQQLEKHIFENISLNRKEKVRGGRVEVMQELQKFTRLDIYGLYEKLWRDGSFLTDSGKCRGADLDEIRRYTLENLESGRLYYDDAIAVLYLYLRIFGSHKYRHIRQVIIDEAQDYYPLQYEIFRMLFPGAKYTVLGDINQTLTKREELSFYEQVRGILKKKNSVLITLDKSFRCTNEILQYGLQFIEERPGIRCFNRSGDRVEAAALENHEAYLDRIVREVEECGDQGFGTVCLICKTAANSRRLFGELQSRLDIRLLREDTARELKGNLIMPAYMAKGLEFDAVIICDADARNYSDADDRKILYVECTRALHRLRLFCEGELTGLAEKLPL